VKTASTLKAFSIFIPQNPGILPCLPLLPGLSECDIRNCGSRSVKQIVASQVEIQANCTRDSWQPDFAAIFNSERTETDAGFGIGFCPGQFS
jgi:hypothetical protein